MGIINAPIYILGHTGFIGKNLMRYLLDRGNAVGCISRAALDSGDVEFPRGAVVFNCIGACSEDMIAMYTANCRPVSLLLPKLEECTYIHLGSSAEYGANCEAPSEEAEPSPSNWYGISKAAASDIVLDSGRAGMRCCNLRLYSVYGPGECEENLIPTIIRKGKDGKLPEFVNADISYDFIHVDDVCRAMELAAIRLQPDNYGEAFNIGTGIKTSIGEVAAIAKRVFGIEEEPRFTLPPKPFSYNNWYANPNKAAALLGFEANIMLEDGIRSLAQ